MRFLYDLGIAAYSLILRLISPFHAKARSWVKGREGLLNHIAQTIDPGGGYIWFHFASLGEFEQGRSVMEAIKKCYPEEKIIITFFSPSGFEIRKHTALAEQVFYLPVDTASNARKFLSLVQPKLAIFTKYEYWYHYFTELQKRGVHLLMISAIFRENQLFFKAYGGFYRSILEKVSYFFAQNKDSVHMLKWIGLTNAGLAGDTRFDRVVDLPAEAREIQEVEQFVSDWPVLVAGSTWPADEALLNKLLANRSDWKLIVAPHEIDSQHIGQLQGLFAKPLLFSQYNRYSSDEIAQAQVLIIDNIGMLSALYRYGQIAYLGGGFGGGIHNTLEAATYGVPVVFGPRYEKFQEAKDLIASEAAFSIADIDELTAVFDALRPEDRRERAGLAAKRYVQGRAGATQIIMKYLSSERLIGNRG
ncbi:MAG: 3-deoxy-D-manno-octulosonic acid transferase [Sphingobacterium sp.]